MKEKSLCELYSSFKNELIPILIQLIETKLNLLEEITLCIFDQDKISFILDSLNIILPPLFFACESKTIQIISKICDKSVKELIIFKIDDKVIFNIISFIFLSGK
jgi:hypothetical protein